MKVVIAPDSFKDALRASEVAQRIADGLRVALPEINAEQCPVSDGGEGFTDAIASSSLEAERYKPGAYEPLGRQMIDASWYLLNGDGDRPSTGVIELASAAGLELLKLEERDPTKTSTAGVAGLISEAIEFGAEQILLGIGGSATHDAGCGIAQMHMQFFDQRDQPMHDWITGGDLLRIGRIVHPEYDIEPIRIACDVENPLTGPNGAAYTYAAQKGATPQQVEQLEAGTKHIAQIWRDQLGVDVEDMLGAGAAGGVGGGLVAMLGAELLPGAELVLDTIGFDKRIKDADLVITGEGRLDSQSLQGKAAMTVAKRCKAAGVPCVALVGSVGEGAEQALSHGLDAYHIIGEGLEPAESIRRTGELLEAAAMKLAQERLT